MKRNIFLSLLVVFVFSATAQKKKEDLYAMSWDSLAQHKIPEWFKDAKFGIYAHLGVYCVPAHTNEWYPRYMHTEGHEVQTYHEKTYGPVSEFGYHDFIPMFKLKNFNADEWAELYKRSGAKFAGPVAEHHDGFSMWASKVNRWNAKDMGPKRDVVGELVKAIRKQDMKVITSFHHGFNLEGYYPTLPGTHTDNPEFADLYGKLPAEQGFERWLKKVEEVIDNYQPDQIWFDWGLRAIPDEYKRKFASYYYSKEKEWKKEVIITRKLEQLPLGVGVHDFEGGGTRDVTPFVWQSDQSTGGPDWSWRDGVEIRSPGSILHELIEIVSKNGILLLNVCPDAEGQIPGRQKEILYKMGDWLAVNGEAIYGTHPWRVAGEGPDMYGSRGYYMFYCSAPQTNPVNVRYTQKDGNLYAICQDWPGEGFTFDKIHVKGKSTDSKITLLGHGEVSFNVEGEKLSINPLSVKKEDLKVGDAWVLKLENFDLEADPFLKLEVLHLHANNGTPTGRIKIRPANEDGEIEEKDCLYHWDGTHEKIYWLANVKVPGEYLIRGEFATRFKPAHLVLSNGEEELKMVTEPRQKYAETVQKDYGTISFKKTGLYRIELRAEEEYYFPGVQRFAQLELAPL